MTKEQVLRIFKEEFAGELKKYKNDKPAKRMLWSNFTDMLCKEGEITLKQYENWDNPF